MYVTIATGFVFIFNQYFLFSKIEDVTKLMRTISDVIMEMQGQNTTKYEIPYQIVQDGMDIQRSM